MLSVKVELFVKANLLVASLLLWFASSATAVPCTSTTSIGSVGPPGLEDFGKPFGAAGSYSDCYTFSLSGDTELLGGVIEQNPFPNNGLEIDVANVALFDGDALSGITTGSLLGEDFAPDDSFTFSGLSLGTYVLVVFSDVVDTGHYFAIPVAYAGRIITVATTPPVPEPASMAVFGLGALIVGAALRKRSRI